MKILQVNSIFSGGGTDNQTIELTAGLRELGVDVALAIAAGSRWEPQARALGVPVETFPPKSPLKIAMIRHLIALIRERGCDILHAHQGRDYWPCVIAAGLAMRNTRVVITRHLMTRPRTVSRWLLLRCTDVIAVSRAVESVLQRELRGPRSRLHQIYGGVNTQLFSPEPVAEAESFRGQFGWNSDETVFGVVGAFDLPRGKGQLDLLAAAAELKTDFPNARYAIIGAGTMETLLRETIADKGLGNIATIIPFRNNIAPAIRGLDVLVHPAVGTEALGLVILEAMASGKPVIASRLHGIPEAFTEGEHGFLISAGDVQGLTAAMRELLANPERSRRFGKAGRDHVCQRFSRQTQAMRMLELYKQIIAR